MEDRHIQVPTIDDMIRRAAEEIQRHGSHVKASRGATEEITGVLMELTNPRARLSRSATRGKIFSSLGELLWYLSGTDDVDFISHYIPNYTDYANGYGAYGPRLFDLSGHNQIQNVISLLKDRKTSRRAAIQIFSAKDIEKNRQDVPCTCTVQFILREDKLNAITYMRSNDLYMGIPHDVFSFTMIQEILAKVLRVDVGKYIHNVGSLHIYKRDKEKINRYLDEGWQPTNKPMPPMPEEDPRSSVEMLLKVEEKIRNEENIDQDIAANIELDEYWLDLIRLLQIFRHVKEEDPEKAKAIGKALESPVYPVFVGSAVDESIRTQ